MGLRTPLHARTKRSIKAADVAMKECSKVLQIRSSTVAVSDSGDIIIERSPVLSTSSLQLRKHLNLIDSLLGEAKTGSQTSPGNCFNCCRLLNNSGPKYGFACCSHFYFCSLDCKNLAKQYYHDALCGTNILPIYTFSKNKKVLPTCKQGGGHPLQHPLIANRSSHEAAAQDPWS
ncbi:uncharacterized protein Bfra_010528 [Botrytis fragariae]|uniref:MYND-type domain-containing protein n=1 Tax=Botrytis fragariae TaxID=1964551 RepID=A0A8H6AHZ1_9HELO|nr:uncharacterized protein Bfra_010528 [Botrytis fragariae]KAF5867553.1 hypothetical protein Bfra_010528 [Botrytis fragariae]